MSDEKPPEGHTLGTQRGRDLEYRHREAEASAVEDQYATRRPLWEKALGAAMYNRHKGGDFEKRLALRQGIGFDLWPEAAPLTPSERTAILRELRQMWGIPHPREDDR